MAVREIAAFEGDGGLYNAAEICIVTLREQETRKLNLSESK